MDDQRVREILLEQNTQFRDLFLAHQECERQLQVLSAENGNSEEDLQKETRLKKEKLMIKDAMQKCIFNFKNSLH